MRIPAFTVRNDRAIHFAACSELPLVMVVTGPNGCGKSTLLNALRGINVGSGRTLYVGPHRNSRRQAVRMRHLSNDRVSMSSLLSLNRLPQFEGIDIPARDRDAWNFDGSQMYLKFSLCQIELDRQAAITARFDATGEVTRESAHDVWAPLRDLANYLLPHLEFDKIDISDRDHIYCHWRVHSSNVLVDLDDLSSGEKAIIQLFFPLIEHQIMRRIAATSGAKDIASEGGVAVLMDEPELHLQPNLQVKILDYIRALALKENGNSGIGVGGR